MVMKADLGPDVKPSLDRFLEYQSSDRQFAGAMKHQVEEMFRKGLDVFGGLPIRKGNLNDGSELSGKEFVLTEPLPFKNGSDQVLLQMRGYVAGEGDITLGGFEAIAVEAIRPTTKFARLELFRLSEKGFLGLGRIVATDYGLVNTSPECRSLVFEAGLIMDHFARNLPSRSARR